MGLIRPQPERLSIAADCFLELSPVGKQTAETVIGIDIVRTDFEGLLILSDGGTGLSLRSQN